MKLQSRGQVSLSAAGDMQAGVGAEGAGTTLSPLNQLGDPPLSALQPGAPVGNQKLVVLVSIHTETLLWGPQSPGRLLWVPGFG